MSERTEQIIKLVEEMTVLELADLVKTLEEKFGVTAAPAMVAAAPGASPTASAAEEKTEFTPVLTGFGANKIQVIKEIRAITGLGLKEAKDLVDNCPNPIKESVTKDEANEIKTKIEAAGGTVEIK
ncbi:MAG: 50S ribosomal protein L7/L12 [Candidatus Coatesbacteria bacterium]|nr:50S ribosomal protein L7/L12 [Candidatus Coatesbacteria bacterium]